jgi:menaquinol-cytochrome c reductase iron-sulfur subunit
MRQEAPKIMASAATSRRGFLSYLTGLLLAVLGLLVAIPAVLYFWAPLRRKRGEAAPPAPGFLDAGLLSALEVGKWHLLTVERKRVDAWQKEQVAKYAVYVRRHGTGNEDVTVLSPVCPHLGCSVNWNRTTTEFECPCHKARFNADGEVLAGPPPRPMDKLEHTVEEGRLRVRWQEFKNERSEQIPMSR